MSLASVLFLKADRRQSTTSPFREDDTRNTDVSYLSTTSNPSISNLSHIKQLGGTKYLMELLKFFTFTLVTYLLLATKVAPVYLLYKTRLKVLAIKADTLPSHLKGLCSR